MRCSGWLSSIVIGIVLAGNLYGGGYASQTDSFNDGVRDKLLWKPQSGTSGRFLETGGHLCLDSITDPSSVHGAFWNWKPTPVLINADVLAIAAMVRMPMLAMPSSSFCDLGIGLQEVGSDNFLNYYIHRNESGCLFVMETRKGSAAPVTASYPLPAFTRFYIKFRYANATGKVTFWYRGVHAASWTKIGSAINLRSRWGRSGVSSLHVQPFVLGYTYKIWVRPSNAVCLDNFSSSLWLNDL